VSGIFKNVKISPFGGGSKKMDWSALSDTLIEQVRERAGAFWDANADARAFVVEKSKELAKLVWKLKTTTDETQQAELKNEIAIVRQTIENELGTIALIGETEAKSTFKEIVNTAFGVLAKVAPVLLSAL
jgi:flagellar biosynthesis/type III secretory pathway chaperone